MAARAASVFDDADTWGDVYGAAAAVLAAARSDGGPARILHTPAYSEASAFLRVLVARGEVATARVRAAAGAVIAANAAHYSAWSVRRSWFDAAPRPAAAAEEEVAYTGGIIRDNSKNYQVWNHRRWVQERQLAALDAAAVPAWAAAELAFTAAVIATDAKHYHAWSHRQWVLTAAAATHGAWRDEMAYTGRLIDADVRNNSAWHHRLLVLRGSHAPGAVPSHALLAEVVFAIAALRLAAKNESAWNYLRALVSAAAPVDAATPVDATTPVGATADAAALALCLPAGELRDTLLPAVARLVEEAEPGVNPFANEFMADLLVGEALHTPPAARGPRMRDAVFRLLDAAADVDGVRAHYWAWRRAAVAAALPAP